VEASPVEASPVEASPVEASPVEVVGARELPEALAAPQTHGPAGEGEEMGLAPAPGEAGP
ncbi:MAG TPA: hypothetical protein VK425_08605, partial [Acidimicrobiales bacterium]|nr:hypothetical protein [Acidimicrobiales bacterium]